MWKVPLQEGVPSPDSSANCAGVFPDPSHRNQFLDSNPSSCQAQSKSDAAFKAEQEKRRREETLAQATGLRVLKSRSGSRR